MYIYIKRETVIAIMMLYKNVKAMLCSADGNTDLFDIVIRIFQGETLASYMFIISQDYALPK